MRCRKKPFNVPATLPKTSMQKYKLRAPARSRLQTLFSWLIDKDHRASMMWMSTGFGSIMISGYYLWLGFTPAFSLGQASLLIFQAVLVGFALTVYFSQVILVAAWAYKLLEISPEEFPVQQRSAAIGMLARRSIAAQFFATPLAFVLLVSPFGQDNPNSVYWGIAFNIALFFGISLTLMPRMSKFGKPESEWAYFRSIGVIGVSGVFGTGMLYLAYSIAPSGQRAGDGIFLLAWIMVTIVSAVLSTHKKGQLPAASAMSFAIFMFLLGFFNVGSMPFRGTAYTIGIAEPGLVTLVLTPATCVQLKQALSDATLLECDGPHAGLLKDVHLMNSLGDRWVLREKNSEENIAFEGKGTVVRSGERQSKRSPRAAY